MFVNSLPPWQSKSLLILVLFVIRMSAMLNFVLVVLGKRVDVRCWIIICALGHAYRACL